jgi:hypothetical protein
MDTDWEDADDFPFCQRDTNVLGVIEESLKRQK